MSGYTAKRVEFYGIGGGVNGYGRRAKRLAWVTVDRQGRKVRMWDVSEGNRQIRPEAEARAAAEQWAQHCNERNY